MSAPSTAPSSPTSATAPSRIASVRKYLAGSSRVKCTTSRDWIALSGMSSGALVSVITSTSVANCAGDAPPEKAARTAGKPATKKAAPTPAKTARAVFQSKSRARTVSTRTPRRRRPPRRSPSATVRGIGSAVAHASDAAPSPIHRAMPVKASRSTASNVRSNARSTQRSLPASAPWIAATST